jgi:hypothetical protein
MLHDDIHTIAEKFLQDLHDGTTQSSFYQAEETDIVTTSMTGPDRVVVARQETPIYLAGIKPSGRPVWTHCLKLASSYDAQSIKLTSVLDRMEQYQIEVDTMPATWFSNHNA